MIEIPARRNWFVILFLGFWLCGWALGEVMVPIKFFGGGVPAPAALFSLVWLGAWTLGGATAITIFAWMLAGREVITVTRDGLSIRRQVRGFGHTRTYDIAHLSRLRLEPHSYNIFDPQMALAFYGLGGGRVAFDYGSSTVRFDNRIDEPDALKVIEVCGTVLPEGVLALGSAIQKSA
jgi:hypothetical protein